MQDMWVQSLGWEDPRSRKWQPTPVFCLGNPMETGTCPATNSPWVRKELDTTEHHHHHMDSSLNLFPIHFLSTTYWIYIQSIKHPSLLSIINLFIRSMAQLRRQSHQQIYKKNHVNQHEGFLWATGQAQILYSDTVRRPRGTCGIQRMEEIPYEPSLSFTGNNGPLVATDVPFFRKTTWKLTMWRSKEGQVQVIKGPNFWVFSRSYIPNKFSLRKKSNTLHMNKGEINRHNNKGLKILARRTYFANH